MENDRGRQDTDICLLHTGRYTAYPRSHKHIPHTRIYLHEYKETKDNQGVSHADNQRENRLVAETASFKQMENRSGNGQVKRHGVGVRLDRVGSFWSWNRLGVTPKNFRPYPLQGDALRPLKSNPSVFLGATLRVFTMQSPLL